MISPYHYFDTLIIVLFAFSLFGLFYSTTKPINYYDSKKSSSSTIIFIFVVLPLILFLGLRPISYAFGDMRNYENYFYLLSTTNDISLFHGSDIFFVTYIKICTKLMNVRTWFFLTAFIAIFLQFWAIKRLFPTSVYLFFLASICSLTFYGSIVNGIRVGIAMSVLLFGLSFYKRKVFMILIFIISIGFHKSMLLPTFASIIALYFKNTKYLIYLWSFTVLLSLVSSSFLSEIFNRIGFVDARLDSYLSSEIDPSKFSHTGFRYDFLLYSSVPIILGLISYKKTNIRDKHKLYFILLNTYIIANAFWVLIIEANYSNRFASLSWILWPFITIYPIIFMYNNKYRNILVFLVIIVELAVTYFIS